MESNTFTIISQPYLDQPQQCYYNILTINLLPKGPLKQRVVSIKTPPLSIFQISDSACCRVKQCALALTSFTYNGLMRDTEVAELFSFLMGNGYTIQEKLTKLLVNNDSGENKTICFVTYNK